MIATINIFTLFSVTSVERYFKLGLEVAKALGLPVTSWQPGDPTRSLYKYLAEALATLEGQTSEFIKAGFLSSAEGEWLKILAKEVYNVDAVEATYASAAEGLTIRNAGGGNYPIAVRDLTVKSTASGKTFHNTNALTISPGSPGSTVLYKFDFEADEAGSDSSVAVGEIDAFVSTYLGLEIVSSAAATAQDEQSPEALREQCRATLGALSPNGPPDAYEYVCRNPLLTGVTDITRAKAFADSSTGEVTIVVASPTGPAAAVSVTAAQAAVLRWATPLTVTPTVVPAVPVTIAVTALVSGDDLPANFASTIAAALRAHFAALVIGEPVATSAIIAAIHKAVAQIDSLELTAPDDIVAIDQDAVPVLGVVTMTAV